MLFKSRNRDANTRVTHHRLALSILLVFVPGVGASEILWDGNFDAGNLLTWWNQTDKPHEIWGVPRYGSPPEMEPAQHPYWISNGDLMWLTDGSTHGIFKAGPILPGRKHSLALHVKSYAGGSVDKQSVTDQAYCSANPSQCVGNNIIGDWDSSVSTRRRSQLNPSGIHYNKNLIPYRTTRWASTSIFIPEDWATVTSGWMTNWQWKAQTSHGSPGIEVSETGGNWELRLRRSHTLNAPTNGTANWNALRFTPGVSGSKERPFYPDETASLNMLGNLNKGGWTHFVMEVHFDGRLSTEGGEGFINLWMRHDNGPWVHVVHYHANPEFGVLYPQDGSQARWAFFNSLYMENRQVLNLPGPGRTLYYDNVKIGSDKATLDMMSHDGSSPGMSQAPPAPPEALQAEVD